MPCLGEQATQLAGLAELAEAQHLETIRLVCDAARAGARGHRHIVSLFCPRRRVAKAPVGEKRERERGSSLSLSLSGVYYCEKKKKHSALVCRTRACSPLSRRAVSFSQAKERGIDGLRDASVSYKLRFDGDFVAYLLHAQSLEAAQLAARGLDATVEPSEWMMVLETVKNCAQSQRVFVEKERRKPLFQYFSRGCFLLFVFFFFFFFFFLLLSPFPSYSSSSSNPRLGRNRARDCGRASGGLGLVSPRPTINRRAAHFDSCECECVCVC